MKIQQSFTVQYKYEIHFTRDVFDPDNELLTNSILKKSAESKIAVVIDRGLLDHWPHLHQEIRTYFQSYANIQLTVDPLIVPGGEQAKNSDEAFQQVLQLIDRAQIDRHSYVMAIGGGAVLDMVGFACSIGHRGIRHIRIPTTVLAQNDSGVGVKNGINYFDKKNFLGAFAPPDLVINDFSFLSTLSDRDWRSGTAEAVKVAAISDLDFFTWLETAATPINQRQMPPMEELIKRCARLHADHISQNNDPFERGSSRPLDFGHWAAHKLEQLSAYQLKHGEAVAIGMALDLQYGALTGCLSQDDCDRVCAVLRNLGFDLFHSTLLNESSHSLNVELLHGLNEFREHLGGQLTITMISEIGRKFDIHEMEYEMITEAALKLAKTHFSYAS